MIQFTLYSRTYCHLCQDMLDQLRAALGDHDHVIDVVDIDIEGNEVLLERYDELVPVLTARHEGEFEQQLCHYFLDLSQLNSFINGSKKESNHAQ